MIKIISLTLVLAVALGLPVSAAASSYSSFSSSSFSSSSFSSSYYYDDFYFFGSQPTYTYYDWYYDSNNNLVYGEVDQNGNACSTPTLGGETETTIPATTAVSPVPLPAAFWFFGVALFSLLGLSRRKLKKS